MPTVMDNQIAEVERNLRGFVDRHLGKQKELDARMLQLEQAWVSRPGSPGSPLGGGYGEKSLGQLVVESEGLQSFRKGARSTGQIEVGSFKASTIVSGTWTAGPDFLPRIAAPPMPTLPLRALIPSFAVTTNMVEYAKEVSATDGSGYQYPEGSDKGQSDLGFTLVQRPVATLATWAAASRQAIDDSLPWPTISTHD